MLAGSKRNRFAPINGCRPGVSSHRSRLKPLFHYFTETRSFVVSPPHNLHFHTGWFGGRIYALLLFIGRRWLKHYCLSALISPVKTEIRCSADVCRIAILREFYVKISPSSRCYCLFHVSLCIYHPAMPLYSPIRNYWLLECGTY